MKSMQIQYQKFPGKFVTNILRKLDTQSLDKSTLFETPEVGIIDFLCKFNYGNKLEIVPNKMNLNTNLDFSRA